MEGGTIVLPSKFDSIQRREFIKTKNSSKDSKITNRLLETIVGYVKTTTIIIVNGCGSNSNE